jgi:hypothetical protein
MSSGIKENFLQGIFLQLSFQLRFFKTSIKFMASSESSQLFLRWLVTRANRIGLGWSRNFQANISYFRHFSFVIHHHFFVIYICRWLSYILIFSRNIICCTLRISLVNFAKFDLKFCESFADLSRGNFVTTVHKIILMEHTQNIS